MKRYPGYVFIVTFVVCGGCMQPQRTSSYQTIRSIPTRDTSAAKEANELGLQHVADARIDLAEKAFREALRADVGYAAAHNNLGLVLQENKKFYESALEFKFASKLNPRAMEPILNLARLYETIGWQNAAIKSYEKAIALRPSHIDTLKRLAVLYEKSGTKEDRRDEFLRMLAAQHTDDTRKE